SRNVEAAGIDTVPDIPERLFDTACSRNGIDFLGGIGGTLLDQAERPLFDGELTGETARLDTGPESGCLVLTDDRNTGNRLQVFFEAGHNGDRAPQAGSGDLDDISGRAVSGFHRILVALHYGHILKECRNGFRLPVVRNCRSIQY